MQSFQELASGKLKNRFAFLDKIKVIKRAHLFELQPDFSLVAQGKCGVCGRKLKFPRSGKIAYCGSKKCPARPKFVITMKKLQDFLKLQK